MKTGVLDWNLDIELNFLVLSETEPENELWWKANHTMGRYQSVADGWMGVARLLAAVDGDRWPWTCIEYVHAGEPKRWVQGLGEPKKMLLEVAFEGDPPRTVFRIAHLGLGWVRSTPECQWWVPSMRADEVLTADEAYLVARSFLETGLLPEGYSSRPLHNPKNRVS